MGVVVGVAMEVFVCKVTGVVVVMVESVVVTTVFTPVTIVSDSVTTLVVPSFIASDAIFYCRVGDGVSTVTRADGAK